MTYEGRKRWVGDPRIGAVFVVGCGRGAWRNISLYLTVGSAQYRALARDEESEKESERAHAQAERVG